MRRSGSTHDARRASASIMNAVSEAKSLGAVQDMVVRRARFVAGEPVRALGENPPMNPTPEQLVPRIKHLAFEQALVRAGIPEAQRPVIEPLCGELVVTYAFDLPGEFVMASAAQIVQAGVPPSQWRDCAVANLRAAMRRDGLSVSFHRPEPPVIEARCGGDLEACLLLVDGFWGHVQSEFGAPVVVAAPRRDVLYIVCAPDAAALDMLARRAGAALHATDGPHGLSEQLMRRDGTAWRLAAAA
jgi:hypothetical protein